MRYFSNVKNIIFNLIKNNGKNDIFHEGFEVGIWIKGIDGILQIIGSLLLIFINPARLNKLIFLISSHEIAEDPNDIFANYLLKISHEFSVSLQYFAILYLFSHGLIKVFLVVMLQKKKLWAYPLTIAFLVLFIFYQVYRYTFSHSGWLILLTIFDLVMIPLTLIERKRIKMHLQN